jgi:hypothetical protein
MTIQEEMEGSQPGKFQAQAKLGKRTQKLKEMKGLTQRLRKQWAETQARHIISPDT